MVEMYDFLTSQQTDQQDCTTVACNRMIENNQKTLVKKCLHSAVTTGSLTTTDLSHN